MLAKIREKTQGIIATFILLLVALVFVIWGVNIDQYLDGSTTAVATVNGREIDQNTYREAVDQSQATDVARKQMVINQIIDQTLLVERAQDNGYRVSGAQLAQAIHQIPFFQRDGKFERALYEALLRRQGMTPAGFEQRMRDSSAVSQLNDGLTESVFITATDNSKYAQLLQQERRFTYAFVRPESYLPAIAVNAKEVEDYYQANQEKFRTLEKVRIAYIVLSATEIAKDTTPTDAELREAYEADAARYITPAKRRVSHILINVPTNGDEAAVQAAKSRSEDLLKQARAGKDFAALAKQHSDDKDSAAKGGDLGELASGLLPELDAVVQKLKQGEIAGPVRSPFGFHVVKLVGYTPEVRRSFEGAKKELVEQVRKRKGEERFYEAGEKLRNLVYEHPEGLDTAAKELDLKVQTSDWFTQQEANGIAAHPRVRNAAFEPEVLSQERNSDVIELSADSYGALHVVERQPSVVPPLADVRAKIEQALKAERARESAQNAAQQWVQKFEQATDINAHWRQLGSVPQNKTVTRIKPDAVNPQLLEAIFAAPRPQNRASAGYLDMGSLGFAVYAVEAVRDADPSKLDAATKEKAVRDLTHRFGGDYYARFQEGLRREADIKINNDLL